MIQKRNELIALGVIFLVLLAGCKGGDSSTGAPTTPFLGGEGKLEIRFLEGNPPSEVTDGGTFPFKAIVGVKNTGETDISRDDMEVSLIGISPNQFNPEAPDNFEESRLRDRHPPEDVNGRKRDSEGNILEPAEAFVEFPDDDPNKNFNFKDQIVGNNVFVFRAEACFKYQTKAKVDICVLQNQIDRPDDSLCNPTEAKIIFSSASPVQITSFRQTVAGQNKIQFNFNVEHIGTGHIFDPATTSSSTTTTTLAPGSPTTTSTTTTVRDCPRDAVSRRAKEDKVRVSVDSGLRSSSSGNFNLNCVGLSSTTTTSSSTTTTTLAPGSPTTTSTTTTTLGTSKQSGIVKLINGKRTITCTLDLPSTRADFIKPIDITVDFNYLQNADKEVLVKHILTDTTTTSSSSTTTTLTP